MLLSSKSCQVSDCINEIPWRWNDDDLIAQVQMLAEELGRTPTYEEFKENPRTASGSTVERHFGKWNKFLEAAGLGANLIQKKK